MTNRQIAAKYVLQELAVVYDGIRNVPPNELAALADKSKMTEKVALKIREQADKLMKPLLTKLDKVLNPPPRKPKTTVPPTETPKTQQTDVPF